MMMMLKPADDVPPPDDEGAPWAVQGRVVPHSIEIEQGLLGLLLLRNDIAGRLPERFDARHFYDALHARIYEVVSLLIASGKKADPLTLRTFFENADPIDDAMTVPQYLGRLAASAANPTSARDYAQTLMDLAARREIIALSEETIAGAYDAAIETPASTLIEDAEQRLYAVADRDSGASKVVTLADATKSAIETANQAYQRDGGLSGLSTGLIDLDAQLGGLHASDLIVLAGRPSMGKTALATNIAVNVARLTGAGRVLFFSLEMSAEQLAARIISDQARIASERVRRGMISEAEFRAYAAAGETVSTWPLDIDQTGGMSMAQMAIKARRRHRATPLSLIVVDYLQLMRGSDKRGQNRVQEITEITTGLKALAKELDIPVLALSQLSRAVEQREDKRPQLSDLRESGSIEQDADVVMFVFREQYYVERRKPPESDSAALGAWQDELRLVHGKADVIIGKQRHGPVGTVQLAFESQFTRFGNLARSDQAEPRHE